MKQGELKTVENKQFEKGAWNQYPTAYLKNEETQKWEQYQFTPSDLRDARNRAIRNRQDIPSLQKSYFSFTWFVIGLAVGVIACVVAMCN